MRRLLLVALACVVVTLSACGRGGEAAAIETTTIDLPKSYRFEPANVRVPLGATVTWTNHDNFTHSVQVDGGETHVMKPGESARVAFETAGTHSYLCTFHPQMKGSVEVE